MPGLIASSSKSEWVFNLRDTSCYDTDSETETEIADPESTAAEHPVTAKKRVTSHNQLLKELDLSAREDSATYVSNPWTIAKQNAACRPSSGARTVAGIGHSNSLKSIESGSGSVHRTTRSNCFPALSVNNKLQEHPKKVAQTTLAKAFTVEKDRFSKLTASAVTRPFSVTPLDLADTDVLAGIIVNNETGEFRPDVPSVNIDVCLSTADSFTQPQLSICDARITKTSPASPTWNELSPHVRSTVFASDIQRSSQVSPFVDAVDLNYKKHSPSSYMLSNVMSARSGTSQGESLHWQTGSISDISPAQRDFSTSDSLPDYATSELHLQSLPWTMQDSFASSFHQRPCNGHGRSLNQPELSSIRKEINPSSVPSFIPHLTETSRKHALRPLVKKNIKLNSVSSLNLKVGPKRRTGDSDDDPDSTWSTLPSRVNKRSKADPPTKFTIKKAGKFRLPIAIQSVPPTTGVTIDTERLPNGRKLTLYKPPSKEEQQSKPQPVILQMRKANLKESERGLETPMSPNKNPEERGSNMEASGCEKVYQNGTDTSPSFSTPCSSQFQRSSPSSPILSYSVTRLKKVYPKIRESLISRENTFNAIFNNLGFESCGFVYRDNIRCPGTRDKESDNFNDDVCAIPIKEEIAVEIATSPEEITVLCWNGVSCAL